MDLTDLVARMSEPATVNGVQLRQPARNGAGKIPVGPVWHCSLRNHADDRILSDEEWAEVVQDVMDRTGIAPRGDLGACRWVAVRHADDHVHISALLIRQDNGKKVTPWNDYRRVKESAEAAEQRYGLIHAASADRTAVRPATRAEMEKSVRRGADETTRAWLRRAARLAAVQAQDPESYFQALRDLEIRVRKRVSAEGKLQGYALGWRHDLNSHGEPVWFSGGTLARDLTMPKLLGRWQSATKRQTIPPAPTEYSRVGAAERGEAVAEALSAIDHATASFASGDAIRGDGSSYDSSNGGEAAGIAHATEDMLAAVTMLTSTSGGPAPRGGPAEYYERAARHSGVGQPERWGPIASQLRSAAWRLAALGSLTQSSGGGAELMLALAALVAEIAAWHEQKQRSAQARAARATCHVMSRRPPGHPGAERGPASRPVQDQSQTRTPRRDSDGPRRPTPDASIAPVVRRRRAAGPVRGRRR